MKCSKQCLYACNNAAKVLGMIKRTIRFKDTRVMLSLYKTLVRPHVEYCVSAWSPHYQKDRELIEKIQRRFTKMINNMEGKSYEERLQFERKFKGERGVPTNDFWHQKSRVPGLSYGEEKKLPKSSTA